MQFTADGTQANGHWNKIDLMFRPIDFNDFDGNLVIKEIIPNTPEKSLGCKYSGCIWTFNYGLHNYDIEIAIIDNVFKNNLGYEVDFRDIFEHYIDTFETHKNNLVMNMLDNGNMKNNNYI